MARVSLGVIGKYDHITPVLKKLEFLRVEHKVLNDICILVYKILKHQLPEWLFDLSTVNELRGTATRQSDDFFILRTILKLVQDYYSERPYCLE